MAYNDSNFNFAKYHTPIIEGATKTIGTTYVDGSDALANEGADFVISFYHLPSQRSIYFKAFITAFNETYVSDWASESVYGRADPIHMFKNTQRKVSLAFKVPAGSEGEAYENLAKVQGLVQFLYPAYTDINSATTICQSPLVRLKVMNLLQKATDTMSTGDEVTTQAAAAQADAGNSATAAGAFYNEYSSSGKEATGGLLGVINNVSINHNIDNPDHGVIEKQSNTIMPKMIEVNLDFAAIHEHTVGWLPNDDGAADFAESTFPYGAPLFDNAAPMPLQEINPGSWGDSSDIPDAYLSEEQKAELATVEQEAAQQAAEDAAESRYSGLMGSIRERRDERAVEKDTASDYQIQAQAGVGNEAAAEQYFDPED